MRTAEVVGALCLATDLAMGFPFEHGLHATQIAVRLGDRLEVDPKTASETYYACLLSYCGCTADAEILAEIFGGDLTAHFGPVLFGSQREVLAGVVRALPDPDSAAPVRAAQIARRLPKAARAASRTWLPFARWERCSPSAWASPDQFTASSPVSRSAGTARASYGGPRGRRSRSRSESAMSPGTPPSRICWEAWSRRRRSSASAREAHLTLRSRTASRTTRMRS